MNEKKAMTKFLSYVHMGANTFRIYLQKTADLELKSILYQIIETLSDHEKTIQKSIENSFGEVNNQLKCNQKMVLCMERMKAKMIKDDFCLCLEILKATHMAVYQSLRFIYTNESLSDDFRGKCLKICEEYDEINDQIRQFIEESYLDIN